MCLKRYLKWAESEMCPRIIEVAEILGPKNTDMNTPTIISDSTIF